MYAGNSLDAYCDDGNTDDGDGCSSACQTEANYECSGGSASAADVCTDICGDGINMAVADAAY